ncbi:MAG: hypothetical protein QNK24_00985 [Desulfuromusa sp.]|nr:hypothetical protein [Desulfuromusa sp.]
MRNLLTLLVLCQFLTACAGVGSVDTAPNMDKVTRGFSESMRWADYPTAATYVHVDVRHVFLEQFPEDDDLHIVESKTLSVVPQNEERAAAVYEMEYYRLPSTRIKKWRWAQQWRFIQETETQPGGWFIENEPPKLPWDQ